MTQTLIHSLSLSGAVSPARSRSITHSTAMVLLRCLALVALTATVLCVLCAPTAADSLSPYRVPTRYTSFLALSTHSSASSAGGHTTGKLFGMRGCDSSLSVQLTRLLCVCVCAAVFPEGRVGPAHRR